MPKKLIVWGVELFGILSHCAHIPAVLECSVIKFKLHRKASAAFRLDIGYMHFAVFV